MVYGGENPMQPCRHAAVLNEAGPENEPPLPCLPCLLFFWFVIAHITHYTAAAGAGTSGPLLCAAPGRVRLTQLRWAPCFSRENPAVLARAWRWDREFVCGNFPVHAHMRAQAWGSRRTETAGHLAGGGTDRTDRSIACACHRRTTADETTRKAKKNKKQSPFVVVGCV